MHDIRIDGIIVNTYGLIGEIRISWLDRDESTRALREQHKTLKSIQELKELIAVNNLNIINAELTPHNTILMEYYHFRTLYIAIQSEILKIEEFKLAKVVYEHIHTVSNSSLNIIHSLEVETSYIETKQKLERIGFRIVKQVQQDPNNKEVYRLSIESIWLKHLIFKEISYSNLFSRLGIELISESYVAIKNIEELKRMGIQLEKVNTLQNQYTTWINKAKLLGILDDYTLDHENMYLSAYKRKELTVVPPVVSISDKCLLKLDNINISESVHKIVLVDSTLTHGRKLNNTKIGKNILKIPPYTLYSLNNTNMFNESASIDTDNDTSLNFDTCNLSCHLEFETVHNLKFRLQYGDNGKLRINYMTGRVEIIENTL